MANNMINILMIMMGHGQKLSREYFFGVTCHWKYHGDMDVVITISIGHLKLAYVKLNIIEYPMFTGSTAFKTCSKNPFSSYGHPQSAYQLNM